MSAPLFSAPEEAAPMVLPVAGEVLGPGAGQEAEQCPECGETFTAEPGAKQSASLLVARHKWNVHKIRKDGTRAPAGGGKGKAPDPVSLITDAHPVAATLSAAGARVTGSGAPRAEQLANALGIGLAVGSQGLARWAVRTDPDPSLQQAPERQEALVAALSLDSAAAAKILAPIARVVAPTELNKKYGRAVVENTDLGPALMELFDLGSVWVQYLAVRRAQVAEMRAAREQAAGPAPVAQVPVPPQAPAPAPAPAAPFVTPPPGMGPDPILGQGRLATRATSR